MTIAGIIAEFETRCGFALPPGLASALAGSAPVTVANDKIFAEPVRLGPVPADNVKPASRLEDFGYRFGTVNNYHTYCQENCFCMDPFNSGDVIFLIGEDGRFQPKLWFADHETTDVLEIVRDVEAAILGNAS